MLVHRPASVALAVLAALALLAAALTGAADPARAAPRAGETPGSGPSLSWRPCGGDFECTTLTVPWDHDAPDGRTLDLAIVRAPARDADRRIGPLLVNPGGPGASAVDYVRGIAQALPRELRDRFDIVGVDPRGSGHSAPVRCDHDMSRYYALDFSPDDDAERQALIQGVQELVDACVAANGDYLAYVSTDHTVRDLDAVRAALGEERLSFLGFSYGTYLGAKYAAAHPDRVRAFVLDGAVDPSLDSETMQVAQAAGFEGVLDGFLKWCAKRPSCAFHRGGRTAKAFDALRDRVDAEGLDVPRTRPARRLSQTELDLAVATALYSGKAGYAVLGQALDAADRGDGEAVARLADQFTDRASDGSYGGLEQSFLAIACADGPPVGTVADVARIEAAAARVAPRTGPALVNNSLACALWPVQGAPPSPVAADAAPPILVLGARRDPATPFAWAESLARQLGDAVLVRAPGSQHTSFQSGNACVDDVVIRYLVDLEVPPRTVSC